MWKIGHGNNKTRCSCPVESSHLSLAPRSQSNSISRFWHRPCPIFNTITHRIKLHHSSLSLTPLAVFAHHCDTGQLGIPCCLFPQHGPPLCTLVSMACASLPTCLSSHTNRFLFTQPHPVQRGTCPQFITLLQWVPLLLPYLRSSPYSLYSSVPHS